MESFFYISQKIMSPKTEPYIYAKDVFFFKTIIYYNTMKNTLNHPEKDMFMFLYNQVIYNDRKMGKFDLLSSVTKNMFFSNNLKTNF